MNSVADPALAEQIRLEVRQIGIPPRPTILAEIDAVLRRDETDYMRLADLIGADVGISAGLIKVANSPFFGMSRKVRTVRECLMVLGMHQIVQIVTSLSLEKMFGHTPLLTRFWDSSARIARVSAWLATRLRRQCRVRPEDAYTFGLFRDCGIPLLLIPFPKEYHAALKAANEETVESFTAVEDRMMGINHAVLGAAMAETWLLADEFIAAIRHHHEAYPEAGETSEAPALAWTLIAVAQLAEHLVQLKTGMAKTHEWDKVAAMNLKLLGIDAVVLEELEAECDGVVHDRRSAQTTDKHSEPAKPA